jgi:hypothetical protein
MSSPINGKAGRVFTLLAFEFGYKARAVRSQDDTGAKGTAMGREAEGTIQFQGQVGAGRILVESTEIILRGEVKGRLPRAAILAMRVEGDDLVIDTTGGPLLLTSGPAVAANLMKTLMKPVPTLREKLGVSETARAGLLWPVTDAVLAAALEGVTAPLPKAALAVAEVLDEAALARLMAALPDLAGRPVWCVNAKGPRPELPEARIREALRSSGWIDSKTTAVSTAVSATRYGLRRG